MVVSDQSRRDLYAALEGVLGPDRATALMEYLPPLGWADVARQSDLVALRGEMAELRGEMAELRAELRGEIAELRGEIKAQLPRLYTANLAGGIAVAGLVLAAARLA